MDANLQSSLPGSVEIPNRHFSYIEARDKLNLESEIKGIGDLLEQRERQFPAGGLISGNVTVRLPDGTLLYGLSFKGDLSKWLRGLLDYARDNKLKTAVVEGEALKFSDGNRLDLASCSWEFY